jgi:serine/threonine protein kinase
MTESGKIGKYQIVSVIGEGGMGRVYEATDPVIGRRVAIKVISLGVDTPDARVRFFREAQAAGCLSHPNIITIHDIGGDANEAPYIVMEFLEGTDLSHQLRAGTLSVDKKLQIAMEICEGLAHAHEKGIIHRDIKPANIFVTGQGHIKIVDFGLARGEASDITHTGTILGTPNYMAPEQIRGEGVDQRADIFAVGVVLYELFSGVKPFAGDTVAATIYKVLQTEPPLIHTVDAALSPALSNVVQRAMAKDKTHRYQTVGALRDALIALSTGRPTEAADLTAFIPVPVRADADAQTAVPTTRRAPWITAGAVAAVAVIIAAVVMLVRPPTHSNTSANASAPTPSTPAPIERTAPPPGQAPAAPPVTQRDTQSAAGRKTAPQSAGEATTAGRAEARADARRVDSDRGESARADRPRGTGRSDAAPSQGAARPPERPTPNATQAAPASAATAQPQPSAQSAPPPLVILPPPVPEPRPEPRRQAAEPPPAAAAPAPPSAPRTDADAAARETPAAAIQRILGAYRGALESRDLAALKRIWPALSGRQEEAIRSEFDRARAIRVGLADVQTSVAGSTATVFCRRSYAVTLTDGQRLDTSSKMTMTLAGREGTWLIDNIRFEAAQ